MFMKILQTFLNSPPYEISKKYFEYTLLSLICRRISVQFVRSWEKNPKPCPSGVCVALAFPPDRAAASKTSGNQISLSHFLRLWLVWEISRLFDRALILRRRREELQQVLSFLFPPPVIRGRSVTLSMHHTPLSLSLSSA